VSFAILLSKKMGEGDTGKQGVRRQDNPHERGTALSATHGFVFGYKGVGGPADDALGDDASPA
jgi:hypothetical protein